MPHTSEWEIHLYLYEPDDDTTVAEAVLETGANTIRAEGRARRRPGDPTVPEIGDELAVGRALSELGRTLTTVAGDDVAALSSQGAGDAH